MPGLEAAPQESGERRGGGRPARISRERILDEARQIPARELSMHVIARRLDVNVAALYYHFESRDALLGALVAQLATEFPVPAPDPANWRRWLMTIGSDLTRFLIANPVILSVRDAAHISHVGALLFESVLETLEPAGFAAEEALRVWKVLTNHIYAEARFAYDRGPVEVRPRKVSAQQVTATFGRDLPRTREMIDKLAERTSGEWLEDWLHWLIALLPEPAGAPEASR